MPSPNLIAATLARRTSRSAICVIGNSIALYNPPIRVAEELIRTLRVGHVFCLLHTGNQPDEKTRHNSRLFAEQVMPSLRNMWAEWESDERWWIDPLEARIRPEATLGVRGARGGGRAGGGPAGRVLPWAHRIARRYGVPRPAGGTSARWSWSTHSGFGWTSIQSRTSSRSCRSNFGNVLFNDPKRAATLLAGATDSADPEALRDFFVANAGRPGTAGKMLFPIPNRRLSKRLYRLTTETLVVWGA
jgi:hypothetical protein